MKTDFVANGIVARTSDNSPTLCRADDNASSLGETKPHSGDDCLRVDSSPGSHGLLVGASDRLPALPRDARLPINRCNLPAVILGGPTYQQHPAPLFLDGVAELHSDLFRRLEACAQAEQRASVFTDYVTVHFRLERPEEAGLSGGRKGRAKANYIRTIRGWSFDSDSREGAVLKGWAESRFGLTPRFHGLPLRDPSEPAYRRYLEMRAQGLYGTNALEAQLDLVYAYGQYELARRHRGARHVCLYRGVNRMDDYERLGRTANGLEFILLNNLNSFSCNRERAGEFGDHILAVDIPLTKIFFYCGLLPGILQGEDEFLVVGGVVAVSISTM